MRKKKLKKVKKYKYKFTRKEYPSVPDGTAPLYLAKAKRREPIGGNSFACCFADISRSTGR